MNRARPAAVLLALAAALTVTACGGGPPAPAAYLSRWGMTVQLIQWQPTTGNQVSGSVVGVSAGGTPPAERLYPFTTGVTGTVNGSRVSLKFGYYTQALTGTLDGGRLTLQGYNATSGAIGTVTWTASSAGAYNAALAALRSRVHQANARAAAALARQRQQAAANAAKAKAKAQALASRQDAANTAASQAAHAACRGLDGDWFSPGTVNYTANGYTFLIAGGPQDASCDGVPYLGSDDSQYSVTINFTKAGAPEPAGGGTGTASQAECTQGYYPDQPAGHPHQQPGNWDGALGLCLP